MLVCNHAFFAVRRQGLRRPAALQSLFFLANQILLEPLQINELFVAQHRRLRSRLPSKTASLLLEKETQHNLIMIRS